ncbi:MAG TPA: hypothetical protein VEY94_07205, partial [Patescibacteria group bacterium]|nr:hypothetical protein [Patescibacteria group bacterium]
MDKKTSRSMGVFRAADNAQLGAFEQYKERGQQNVILRIRMSTKSAQTPTDIATKNSLARALNS